MIAGGLYSASHTCLLSFAVGFEGSFMFRGSQAHGTILLILKCPVNLEGLKNIEDGYKKPGNDKYIYFPAIFRHHFGLKDASKYSSKTWGWHPVGGNPIIWGGEWSASPDLPLKKYRICGVSQLPLGKMDENRVLTEKEKERILLRNAACYRRMNKEQNKNGNMVYISMNKAVGHAIQQGWNKFLRDGANTPLGRYETEPGWARR
jgi:hypothetical protein